MKLVIRKVFGTVGNYSEVSIPGEQYNQVWGYDAEKKTSLMPFEFVNSPDRNKTIKAISFDDGVKLFTCYNKATRQRMPMRIRTADLSKVSIEPSKNQSIDVADLEF